MASNDNTPSPTPTSTPTPTEIRTMAMPMAKKDFIAFIKKTLQDPERQFSWIVIKNKIFDWVAINNNHLTFIEELVEELKTISYNEAYIGIFMPCTKTTQYLTFMITE